MTRGSRNAIDFRGGTAIPRDDMEFSNELGLAVRIARLLLRAFLDALGHDVTRDATRLKLMININ